MLKSFYRYSYASKLMFVIDVLSNFGKEIINYTPVIHRLLSLLSLNSQTLLQTRILRTRSGQKILHRPNN